MSRSISRPVEPDSSRRVIRRPGRLGSWVRQTAAFGWARIAGAGAGALLWMTAVSLAMIAGLPGCGKDEEPAPPPPAPAESQSSAGEMPQPPRPKPQPKEEETVKEEEPPLPEDFAQWKQEHYDRAKKEGDPRLLEAVAYVDETYAGTDNAHHAARLLAHLLEKTPEPEPEAEDESSTQQSAASPPGSPGTGYPEGGSEGSYEEMYEESYEESYEEGYPGEGYPGGGYEGYEGYPGSGPGGGQPQKKRIHRASPELIRAIVHALGNNGSDPARTTLASLVEGTYETDNNPVATVSALEALVANISPENEAILFRALTVPEKLRPLGKEAPGAGAVTPGEESYQEGYEESYEGSQQYMADYSSDDSYPGSYGGGYGMGPGGSTPTKPLTAEELQKKAFALVAPVASEELRVKLAKHIADPQTPREDLALFGKYLREFDPKNLSAQMVLYLNPTMDQRTKDTVEDYLISYSADALAGILGVPAEMQGTDRGPYRRGGRRGPGGSEMYEGYEEGYEESYEESYDEMESSSPYGGMDPGRPPENYDAYGSPPGGSPAHADAPSGPGEGPQSDRPSRYGDAKAQDKPQAPAEPAFEPPDPDLPYRMAEEIWGSQLPSMLNQRLAQAESLDADPTAFLLAGTMPLDAMRTNLRNLLQAHWEQGPAPLESAGLIDRVVTDPGFLVLVKLLPRKDPPDDARPGRTRPQTPGSPPGSPEDYGEGYGYEEGMESGQPRREARAGGARPADDAQAKTAASESWMLTSEDLVRAWCERLHSAAQSGQQPPAGDAASEMPVQLHGDASVVAEYHLDWPAAVGDKLQGVSADPLKIHYVRMEQRFRPRVLMGFYERKMTSPSAHKITGGAWLDSCRELPNSDWLRSIDVVITATEDLTGKAPTEEMDLVVEVLVIDIKKPGPPAKEA